MVGFWHCFPLPVTLTLGSSGLLTLASSNFIPDMINHGTHSNSSLLEVCKMLACSPVSSWHSKKESFFPAPARQISFAAQTRHLSLLGPGERQG